MDYTKKDLRDAQAILRAARDRGGDWKMLWSANGWLAERVGMLEEPVMRLDAGEPVGELVGGGR